MNDPIDMITGTITVVVVTAWYLFLGWLALQALRFLCGC